ncbi:MAG: hypothetical protein A3J27_09650 [Candidatus Tectomicrobia bacterium RIFCSPLOWO2_12_FULL_69_37]|nr:MAG: hypothetical protein A3I72_04225 [Candidatus Tectomicrobia bacterium RIFCSPLOWO2_02_FULL_70_19]OGL61725.1 MAG: hypothetical protein A3J27_09650 [Candidatus Tectomicrobia bacterium RIFCSPLOWO2_12_FULL_69_37]
MSEPIGIVGFEKAASLPAPPPARSGGDFGFAELLDAARAGGEDARSPSPSVTAYNSLNLLNGKFPPPDSGAGFIFTVVTLQQDAT